MPLSLKASQNPDPFLSPDTLPSSIWAPNALSPLLSVAAEDVSSGNSQTTRLTHKPKQTKEERKGVEFTQYSSRPDVYTLPVLPSVMCPWLLEKSGGSNDLDGTRSTCGRICMRSS